MIARLDCRPIAEPHKTRRSLLTTSWRRKSMHTWTAKMKDKPYLVVI